MNVMDLVAKISLDSGDYEKNVDSAKSSFSGLGTSIANGAKTIGKVAVGAFTAVSGAIAGATTALISNAKETAEYADNIDKMSQKMGFTTDAFQEWDFIMQHNGSSIEAVKGAMLKLDKAIEADSEAFKELGLNQATLNDMTKEEQWESVVKHLQEVEDQTEKTRLAEEIFGKSYMEMMPVLNQTKEETEAMKEQVKDLGGVMSEDAVKAGAQFKDSMQNLNTAITGAKNNLMAEFLPSLSTVMDGLSALVSGDESGIGKITQGIEDFASKLNEKLPTVIQTAGQILNSLISALPQAFDAIASQLPSILEQAIPTVINAVVGLADAVVKALPQLLSAIQSNIGVITSGLSKIIKSIGQIILKLTPVLLPMLLQVGMDLVMELAQGFSDNASEVINTIITLINMVVEQLTNPETLTMLLNAGLQILMALVNGIAENLPLLLETVGTLLVNVVTFIAENLPNLISQIGQMGAKVVTDILPTILTSIGTAVASMILKVSDGISDKMIDLKNKASEFFGKIPEALMEGLAYLAVQIGNFASSAIDFFKSGFQKIKDIGKNIVEGLWNGINDAKNWVIEKIKSFSSDVLSGIKSFFGISSPSKKTAVFGRFLAEGLAVGVEDEAPHAFSDIQDALDDGMDSLSLDPLSLSTDAMVSVNSKNGKKSSTESKMDMLLDLMTKMVNNRDVMSFPIFVGGKQIDEVFIDSKYRVTTRSGGQVSV